MSSWPRWLAAVGFSLMWTAVTYVREWYFEPDCAAWWALLAVALACGFTAGWLMGHTAPRQAEPPDIAPVQ